MVIIIRNPPRPSRIARWRIRVSRAIVAWVSHFFKGESAEG